MNKIEIWTDGSCSGNPGPGGWAWIMKVTPKDGVVSEYSDFSGEYETTNNRMELTAIYDAVTYLTDNIDTNGFTISIYSDSAYIVNSINNGWMRRWVLTKDMQRPNIDLWIKLYNKWKSSYKLIKVKAHANDEMNNKVDEMAVKARNHYTKK